MSKSAAMPQACVRSSRQAGSCCREGRPAWKTPLRAAGPQHLGSTAGQSAGSRPHCGVRISKFELRCTALPNPPHDSNVKCGNLALTWGLCAFRRDHAGSTACDVAHLSEKRNSLNCPSCSHISQSIIQCTPFQLAVFRCTVHYIWFSTPATLTLPLPSNQASPKGKYG